MLAAGSSALPEDHLQATLVGRVWRPGIGPSVVTVREGIVVDITSRDLATIRDLAETDDLAGRVRAASGVAIGPLEALLANSDEAGRDPMRPFLLAPIDLQAVKAAGVTFVVSLLERVIEEQARGAPERAAAIRGDIGSLIGSDLSRLRPGSAEAMQLKQLLISRGVWSQYLEVGIGPDAEIFTKAQPLSAVGFGATVGLHPISTWNNPEPEVVIVVNSKGGIVGATLGNDVNLRDVEGRSALLLGKAKDNNASAALGPFIRLFDADFGLDNVKSAVVGLEILGVDGFELRAASDMAAIARPPEDLAQAAIGRHHQYPDGLVLYLGTMFAPVADRHAPGKGFTHALGDVVRISTPGLGTLSNRVGLSTEAPPWAFGAADLMRNLAGRGLL
ncbi:MAG: fumarylacetoacetate hydrolase family protein [Ancalomicrobiaceae bacterium]|nr:fumarylacetoacetate hydrolase family protein [Ancalomicrobiaceae bacterium]